MMDSPGSILWNADPPVRLLRRLFEASLSIFHSGPARPSRLGADFTGLFDVPDRENGGGVFS
jgi:hypothetical protein